MYFMWLSQWQLVEVIRERQRQLDSFSYSTDSELARRQVTYSITEDFPLYTDIAVVHNVNEPQNKPNLHPHIHAPRANPRVTCQE